MVRLKEYNKLLFILMITTVWLTACGCPEDDETRYKFEAFSISIPNMATHQWVNRFSIDTGYGYQSNLSRVFSEFSNDLKVSDKEMLFGNIIIPFGMERVIEIPSRYSNCSLTTIDLEYVCVQTEADTLLNPISGNKLFIENAKSSVVKIKRASDVFAISEVLAESEASFISKNRYKISSYSNPQLKTSGAVYVQKNDVSREIVTDSTGNIINDVLFFRETVLNRIKNEQSSTIVNFGTINANETLPKYFISKDEEHFMYVFRNDVYLKNNSNTWSKVAEGKEAFIFDNGNNILVNTNEGYQIVDLNSNDIIEIPVENYKIRNVEASLESDMVYFIESWVLKGFNPKENKIYSLRDLEELRSKVDEEGGDNYYHSLQPVKLSIYGDNSPNILMISNSSYNYHTPCK